MEYTLHIKGDAEDDFWALKRIVEVLEEELGLDEESHAGKWDDETFVEFWEGLKGNAKKALREMSEQPDGYPIDDLLSELGINGATLGGHLSSVGFRMRHFPENEWPCHRDWEKGVYVMPSEVAKIIQNRGL